MMTTARCSLALLRLAACVTDEDAATDEAELNSTDGIDWF